MQHRRLNYKLAEAADLLSLSIRDLRRKLDAGVLSSNGVGRDRRISWAQIDDFVKRREGAEGFVR